MSVVFAVVSDLFFADRIESGLRRLGHEPQVVDLSVGGEAPAIPPDAALVLVDLEGGDRALAAVQAAREVGLPVLCFGPHTDLALRQAALEAGATRVVAKSKLTASFAELVQEMIP